MQVIRFMCEARNIRKLISIANNCLMEVPAESPQL